MSQMVTMPILFKNNPNAAESTTPQSLADFPLTQGVDPLPQYASHKFIPYLPEEHKGASSSRSTPAFSTQPLELYNSSTWTYSGPLLSSDPSSLPQSFLTWATATISDPSVFLSRLIPLLSFLRTFLASSGAHHYWLTIRATKPTKDYDIPRWHTDENFFSYDPEADGLGFSNASGTRCWKLATTLLGPSTLFFTQNAKALHVLRQTKRHEREKMGQHTCTSIRCLGCSTYADCVRESLARSLSTAEVTSSGPGEIAFFRLGDTEGAVHSEPKCDTNRIFVNVVPGTEADLRHLMGRWGMSFPRAWCFGVPVGFVPSNESASFIAREEGSGGAEMEGKDDAKTSRDVRSRGSSTMRANMGDEYGVWLETNGFRVAKIFGQT